MSLALIGLVLPTSYAEYSARLQDVGSQLSRFTKRKGYVAPVKADEKPEPMDWESTKVAKGKGLANNCGCRGQDHVCGRKRAKWVSQDTMDYRKKSRACLRCGHAGHMVKDCQFLPARRPSATPRFNQAAVAPQVDPKLAQSEALDEDEGEDDEAGKA